ncbi:MAG TPA: hypothetical protein VFH40_04940 [Gemmatimonadales bacterium]|nr:hypothetical protein [Gemmatimonadales bacterium]
MRLVPLLFLIPACSRELAPPRYTLSSLPGASLNASFPGPLLDGDAGTQTVPWADTSQVGDTTFYSKGRVVTTVSIFTDSQWTVRPPVILGLPSGPFNLPPDSLCTLGYTATTFGVVASNVLGRLDRVRACKGRAFVVLRERVQMDASGKLSVQAAKAELETWPWAGLCGRVKDSTVIAFYIGDDVTAPGWGPAPLATRLAQWDSIAGLIRSRCPAAPIAIRALPTQLETRPQWQWITTAWAQYTGPRRHGTPDQFLATQVASAKRQRLGLVAGLNLLNGGCGPATTGWCLPDVPGTSALGTRGTDLYQMSAAEFVYYKTVVLSDPYICASLDWSWGPVFDSDFHSKPEIRSAAKSLGVLATQRPLTGCVRR